MARQPGMPGEEGDGPLGANVDLWTVGLVTVVAYVAAVFTHEALGHGGAALLMGARIVRVSTVDLRYEGQGLTSWDHRAIAAAGTAANLLAGLIAVAAFHAAQRASAVTRYAFWLFGYVNLFTGGGYPMALAFAGFGDWDGFTRGLHPRLAWQAGVTLFGVAVSFTALAGAVRSLEFFLGREPHERRRRAVALTIVPYVVGGTVNTLAALFNPAGAHLIVLSAMAGTFGGTAFLAWLPMFARAPRAGTPDVPLTPTRSPTWMALGAAALVVHVAVLAPGFPR